MSFGEFSELESFEPCFIKKDTKKYIGANNLTIDLRTSLTDAQLLEQQIVEMYAPCKYQTHLGKEKDATSKRRAQNISPVIIVHLQSHWSPSETSNSDKFLTLMRPSKAYRVIAHGFKNETARQLDNFREHISEISKESHPPNFARIG